MANRQIEWDNGSACRPVTVPVFKTGVRRLRRLGWVRLPLASANFHTGFFRRLVGVPACSPNILPAGDHSRLRTRVLRKRTFFPILFSRALPCQSLFHSALFARLQVIRVTFHFFNNVFRLNLTFESTERIL